MPTQQQEQLFADHVQWLASVRAAHERLDGTAGLSLSLAELDFDREEPVYRSLGECTGGWQRADEVDLDFEEPVYRSLGMGVGAGAAHAALMSSPKRRSDESDWDEQSMPPLVKRQRARHF